MTPRTMTAPIALAAALALPLTAQAEVPSTVNAPYVAESAETALEPGQKVENLFSKNMTQDYVLQKLNDRVYWVEGSFYATIFYVGDGRLLFSCAPQRTSTS
ncbi:hypothetical protein [Sagittula sp. S175]|uniref:hypothetical protein n=1 Tax=Sagittula sp. S175 TaxID=3415129 RepID=UPI003C7CE5B6